VAVWLRWPSSFLSFLKVSQHERFDLSVARELTGKEFFDTNKHHICILKLKLAADLAIAYSILGEAASSSRLVSRNICICMYVARHLGMCACAASNDGEMRHKYQLVKSIAFSKRYFRSTKRQSDSVSSATSVLIQENDQYKSFLELPIRASRAE
jgi:hypothetical protein